MNRILKKATVLPLSAVLFISCASVPQNNETAKTDTKKENPVAIQAVDPVKQYKDNFSTLKFTLVSSPKETTKGKSFSSPYTIKVEDSSGVGVEALEIYVSYPSSRSNGEIGFSNTIISTDSEGNASFLPSAPEYSFDSQVSFCPNGDMSNEEIKKIASSYTVKAPYKVQTNLKSAGGVIALVDFNKNGKAITSNPVSSSNLLMTLMRLGFTRIGNIDLTNQVIMDDTSKIQSRAKSIVGNGSNFLIYGTVKIDSSEKTDAGFNYKLTGNVKCMDLKTGNITFVTSNTVSITEKNDWNALANARKALAENLAKEIRYGI